MTSIPTCESEVSTHSERLSRRRAQPSTPSEFVYGVRERDRTIGTNINFYQRPNDLGQEFQRLVNDGYDYRNRQLHSGAAGVNGLTDETLTALSANALHVVHTIAIGPLELIATELRVRQSIENFAVRLEDLRLIPGLVLADVRLQSVGEPQRVFISHPQPVAAAPA